jgi:hypothetical protein
MLSSIDKNNWSNKSFGAFAKGKYRDVKKEKSLQVLRIDPCIN